jgi:hypothetical protein
MRVAGTGGNARRLRLSCTIAPSVLPPEDTRRESCPGIQMRGEYSEDVGIGRAVGDIQ